MTQIGRNIIDRVREVLAESGYEIVTQDIHSLRVRELSTGVVINSVLESDVLFNTVSCMLMDSSSVSAEMMQTMLDAENGISTSFFQLYNAGDGKTNITLNNYCMLLSTNLDSEEDILSCFCFLIADTFAALELFGAANG